MHKNRNVYDESIYFDSTAYELISVKEQLAKKQAFLNRLFAPNAVDPIAKNPQPRNYRHKAILSAVNKKVGEKTYKVQLGLYKEGTKTVKPNLNHFLHDYDINNCFNVIEQILHKYRIKAYHPSDKSGLLLHVLIRKSFSTGEMMVIFVTMGNLLPNSKKMIADLIARCPKITTVVQNIHKQLTAYVVGDNEKILYGSGYITDKIGSLNFRISSKAFYQVNPYLHEKIYTKALEMASISKDDVIIDAYCGIGTITLLAALKAKKVIGVESNPAAVQDAIFNMRLNKITNASFIKSDVDAFITNFDSPVDVVIMDPPRIGSTLKFIQALKKLNPKTIVYISCEPKSQKRDIDLLANLYDIKQIAPFDMFSYTAHLENIVLLKQKN